MYVENIKFSFSVFVAYWKFDELKQWQLKEEFDSFVGNSCTKLNEPVKKVFNEMKRMLISAVCQWIFFIYLDAFVVAVLEMYLERQACNKKRVLEMLWENFWHDNCAELKELDSAREQRQ